MTASDGEGHETLDNTRRGCGHLKNGQTYLRSPPQSALGTLPTFVRFDPPIPYYEDHFRGYQRFPGVQFELQVTPAGNEWSRWSETPKYDVDRSTAVTVASSPTALATDSDKVDQLRDVSLDEIPGEQLTKTDPPLEIQRHIRRMDRSEPDVAHVGGLDAGRAHDIIQWVGESYYPEPQDFIEEGKAQCFNKAIPCSENQPPPVVNPGRTRLFIIHPNAVPAGYDDSGDPQYTPGVIGYCYLHRVVITENKAGDWAQWQKDLADTGRVDLVRVGEPTNPDDEGPVDGSLGDYTSDDEGESGDTDQPVGSESSETLADKLSPGQVVKPDSEDDDADADEDMDGGEGNGQ